jgi:hypothetical protein
MTAPNLVSVATINLKTTGASLTTSLADILVNASSSNKALKINGITISNTGTSEITTDVVVDIGGTNYYLIKTGKVLVGTSLIVVSKGSSGLYLEENTKIEALASAATASIVITYEELS